MHEIEILNTENRGLNSENDGKQEDKQLNNLNIVENIGKHHLCNKELAILESASE